MCLGRRTLPWSMDGDGAAMTTAALLTAQMTKMEKRPSMTPMTEWTKCPACHYQQFIIYLFSDLKVNNIYDNN